MRKQKGFDKRFFLAAIIAMVVIAITTFGCDDGSGGGGGGGGAGGDGGDDFGCLPHENPALFYTDKNQNGVPVLTLYTSWAFYECVADGDTIPEYPCFTRNSGPPETSTEIPTAYCGGITTDTDGDGVTDTDDCAPLDNSKWAMTTVRPDGDFDTIPNTDAPQSMCLGNTTPTGWTRTGLPLDNCLTVANPTQTDTDGDGIGDACESDPGNPAVTIPEPLPGDTFYVNEGFPVTVTVAPYIAAIQNVSFNVGGNTTMCPADSTVPYNCTVTPTALGNLTITATAHAANGRTGTASVTVVVISRPITRPILRIVYGWYMSLYHSMTTNCFQNRPWTFEDFVTCGGPGDLCVMQGEMSDYAIAAGNCEWNMTAASGGGGNPNPSFPDACDFSLTGYFDSVTGQAIYDDELTSQYVEISYDGGVTWQTLIDTYMWHSWGANYTTLTTATDDDTLNVTLNTAIDPDGDAYVNQCPENAPACIADNCKVYFNPDQLPSSIPNVGAACVSKPDPFWNDSDNDGFWDGVDLFPHDPTRV